MTKLALIDADIEASGHPTSCEEPASGTIVSEASHGISVEVGGNTYELATIGSADLSLPSHAHQYNQDDGCYNYQGHTLDGSGDSSITVNGEDVYLVEDGVASDPVSGGSIDITNNPTDLHISIE